MKNVEAIIYTKISNVDTKCQHILSEKDIKSQSIIEDIMNPLWDDIFNEIQFNINNNLNFIEY